MKHKIIQKNDILLISAILLAACFLAVFFFVKEDSTEGAFLEITADGELYGRYPLNEDAVIEINGTNVCEISNGHVSMIEADCADKRCVRMKKISFEGESIICLPNRIVLKITGGASAEEGVDTVAG